MKVTLLCVGKIKAPHADADAHYRKLLSRYLSLEVVELRDDADVAGRIPAGVHTVALDPKGRALDSPGWAAWLENRLVDARDVCLLVGGHAGLAPEVLAGADERVSFGPATLPHQLARVVLVEQLFRAAKIRAGEPYHH